MAVDKGLLIEGWRHVNHSYALINQHQALAMKRQGEVRLFHRDLPFAMPHWSADRNDAGFDAPDRDVLAALGEPPEDADLVDAVYRICSPFRVAADDAYAHHRTTTFMITEIGLSPESFSPGADRSPSFTRDRNAIVTSTEWSRSRIIEYGFLPERVHTVPLGVDTSIFKPVWPNARSRSRDTLGIAADETLFLNIGPPLWNKGIDVLLRAFALLRLRGLKVRLLVKDQQDVYGISLQTVIRTLGSDFPPLLRDVVLSGIVTVPMNLSPAQLAMLFGAADCYVSPYRAEGFNLPVLEAIACEVPSIVTRGGATDDFCTDATSVRIPGRFHRKDSDAGLVGAYVEPELDILLDAMASFATGWRPDRHGFDVDRRSILQRFSWQQAAAMTTRLALH